LEKSCQLRLCPKLTEEHFLLSFGKKMRVSLAVQVLSHSVAAALKSHADSGRLPETVHQTANFVARINKLFDIGNSCSISAYGDKRPITLENLSSTTSHMLQEMEWIREWRFHDTRVPEGTVRATLPFQRGLLVTLASLCGLADRLLTVKGFKYFCTRRCNQDCAENVFATIRRNRGGFNDQPEAQAGIHALRFISCTSVLESSVSKFSNRETTGDEMLIQLGKYSISISFVKC
jgi:hypothetical protein